MAVCLKLMPRVAMRVVPAACLLFVTACGSENTDSGGSPTTSTSNGHVEATMVTVQRTGGIAGVHDTWTVRVDKPGDLSPHAAGAVLRIASSPAFQGVEPTKPTQVCCDFFTYAVTVSYSDGSHIRLQTDDSSPQPAPLAKLLGFFT
jgi:hypothetical protein